MVGQRANLFRSKFPYETHFESAAGLVAGNHVSLERRHRRQRPRGACSRAIRPTGPSGSSTTSIAALAPMIRKGTRASIKTIGLLGDKYIELEGGKADEPEVPIGGEIPPARARASRSSSRAAATS